MNKELHKKFVSLGNQRNKITHELLLLLPEICKQKVYKFHGCANIYEYAARFGGELSGEVINKVIKVEYQLSAAGCQNLFETVREQGIHKVAIVARLATKENEEELIKVVENLPKAAVQEYSREKRGKISRAAMKIELDEDMRYQLEKMKHKMGVHSNKEILKRLIQEQFEHFFPGENFDGAEGEVNCEKPAKNPKKITRYIPKQKRTQTLAKNNGRCSHANCQRAATQLHHQNGYAKTKSHENLVALCEIHHKMEHAGLYHELTQTDVLYLEHRRLALN